MKYILKNKIFSIGDGSTVRDESGRDLFFVKGKVFTFTKKKYVRDLNKNVLYVVRNKFFHLLLPKVFLCDASGEKLMMIKKEKLFAFRQNFEIVPLKEGQPKLSVNGDIIARHFDILEDGVPVAHVRKNFNLIKDSFWIDTDKTDMAPLIIAFVVAIDNYYDKVKDQNR